MIQFRVKKLSNFYPHDFVLVEEIHCCCYRLSSVKYHNSLQCGIVSYYFFLSIEYWISISVNINKINNSDCRYYSFCQLTFFTSNSIRRMVFLMSQLPVNGMYQLSQGFNYLIFSKNKNILIICLLYYSINYQK